jgi:hypothetical protein
MRGIRSPLPFLLSFPVLRPARSPRPPEAGYVPGAAHLSRRGARAGRRCMCAYMDALFAGTLCPVDRPGRADPEPGARSRWHLRTRLGRLMGRRVLPPHPPRPAAPSVRAAFASPSAYLRFSSAPTKPRRSLGTLRFLRLRRLVIARCFLCEALLRSFVSKRRGFDARPRRWASSAEERARRGISAGCRGDTRGVRRAPPALPVSRPGRVLYAGRPVLEDVYVH